MEKQIEIVAFHGWGMDGTFWNDLRKRLPENVTLREADRGYFGSQKHGSFGSAEAEKVLMTHSFGLHWCPASEISKADHVVVFNGFGSFAGSESGGRRQRTRIIDRMLASFSSDPERLMTEFYKNCGLSTQVQPDLSFMQPERLMEDLLAMKTSSVDLPSDPESRWLFIDSAHDRIIPGLRGCELSGTVTNGNCRVVDTHTHVLPVSKTEECVKILFESIPIFNSL